MTRISWTRATWIFVVATLSGVGCAMPENGTDATAEELAFRNVTQDISFVGDDACFQCHEDQYQGFKEHGMAHSFYPLNARTAVEAFGSEVVVDSISGYRYRTYERDGRYMMEEYQVDSSGLKTHSLDREMEFVMGSGTIARTYITRSEGWYYELPVTWYTNTGTWDFSPGYRANNSRFDRKIADRCMACHNSYPDPILQTDGAYDSVPEGIGCERCHGPGALHVEERLASGNEDSGMDDSIVNPAHLSLDLQLDVCQQCHLNGTVSLLRGDNTAYSFRPSEPLDSYLALFDTHSEASEGSIGVISHAERMMQSACFLETLDGPDPVQCTTCHDPHEGFRDKGPTYFNETCATCHDPESLDTLFADSPASDTHTIGANCVACHMPKADIEEAPHSAFTDHWIRVVGENDAPRPVRAQETKTLTPYFERDETGEGRMYLGMAYVVLGRQEGDRESLLKGIATLEEAFADGFSSGEARYLQGFAYQLIGDAEASIEPLEAALRDDPTRAERLNTLAQSYERTGRDPVKTRQLYVAALQVQPKLASIRINYGRFLESRGSLDAAKQEYERATMDEPWSVPAWYNLGTAHLRSGDLDTAEEYLQKALSLDPRYVPAWSNLGFVAAQRGNLGLARERFEKGVSIDPNNFEALDNLGTFFLNEGNDGEAVRLLARAVTVQPEAAASRAKLALAYFRFDDFVRAGEEARRVLSTDPANEMARQILIALD